MTAVKQIINVSEFLIRNACENTTSGNFIIDTDEITKATGMDYMDILYYRDAIIDEMYEHKEILDVEYDIYNDHFDIVCALDYCPKYEPNNYDE